MNACNMNPSLGHCSLLTAKKRKLDHKPPPKQGGWGAWGWGPHFQLKRCQIFN